VSLTEQDSRKYTSAVSTDCSCPCTHVMFRYSMANVWNWNCYLDTEQSAAALNIFIYVYKNIAKIEPLVFYCRFCILCFVSQFFVTLFSHLLTLSLLMSYIYGAPSKATNVTSCIYGRDFLLGILLLEPCISLIYAWKTIKYTDYSFGLLIMYGSSYMFRHYIAILRERSYYRLRDAHCGWACCV
jgi:hypothetical protein